MECLSWEKQKPSSRAYDQRQPQVTGSAPPPRDALFDFPLQFAIIFIFRQPLLRFDTLVLHLQPHCPILGLTSRVGRP